MACIIAAYWSIKANVANTFTSIVIAEASTAVTMLVKERLEKLVARAVCDVWRKETGSLNTVTVEATVCITCNGSTFSLHVTDTFAGKVTENIDDRKDDRPHIEWKRPSQGDHPLSSNELSPVSLYSPSSEESRCRGDVSVPSRDSCSINGSSYDCALSCQSVDSGLGLDITNDQSAVVSSEIISSNKVSSVQQNQTNRFHPLSDISSDLGNAKAKTIPSTAHQLPSFVNTSTPKANVLRTLTPLSMGEKLNNENCSSEDEINMLGLDLTKRDGDLALSSPQSYTAQVHDVIKQRLVAKVSRGKLAGDNFNEDMKRAKYDYAMDGASQNNQSSNSINLTSVNSIPSSSTTTNSMLGSAVTSSSNIMLGSAVISSSSGMLSLPLYCGLTTLSSTSTAYNSSSWTSSLPSPLTSVKQDTSSSSIFRNESNPSSFFNPFASPMFRGFFQTMPFSMMCNIPGGMRPLQSPMQSPLISATSNDKEKSEEHDVAVGESNDQKTYRCEYCGKTFLFRSKYHEHLPVHTNARPFQCSVCDRTYKYKYDLRVHYRTHQGIPTKSTHCPHCPLKFDTNKLLRMHISSSHRDTHEEDSLASDSASLSQDDSQFNRASTSQDDSQFNRVLPSPNNSRSSSNDCLSFSPTVNSAANTSSTSHSISSLLTTSSVQPSRGDPSNNDVVPLLSSDKINNYVIDDNANILTNKAISLPTGN